MPADAAPDLEALFAGYELADDGRRARRRVVSGHDPLTERLENKRVKRGLWRLRRRFGAAYSLWNRDARCWTRGCPGRIHFLASCGDSTPFIHLRDRRRKKG